VDDVTHTEGDEKVAHEQEDTGFVPPQQDEETVVGDAIPSAESLNDPGLRWDYQPMPPADGLTEPRTTEIPLAAPAPAAPATSGPSRPGAMWVVIPLVAAIIGALVGGGIVAATRKTKTVTASSFGPNQSVIAKPQDIQGILARVQPGVVSIRTQAFQQSVFGDIPAQGAGTGMLITPDGDVLTNAHVVKGATSIKVTLYNEKDPRDADLLGSDPSADVAVVKIRNVSGLSTVKFGSSKDARVGDDVLAIGNALALPGGPSVTEGIVSAKDRTLDPAGEHLEGLLQTDAAINPGNSGGPLVNANGEVIGMNTAVIQSTGQELAQNIGFAIAIDTIKPLVERLKTGAGVVTAQPFLGVNSQTLTPDVKARYGFTPDKGAVVVDVVPGSPAENGGLQQADVITRFGGQGIESADDLVSAVRSHKPGDKVDVTFYRGANQKTVTVTLGSRQVGSGG
jgi:putative serine protease PepD